MTSSKSEEIEKIFCGRLSFLLTCSEVTYENYKKRSRTYAIARALRRQNMRIVEHLLQASTELRPKYQKDVAILLSHYDVWLEQFDMRVEELNPQPSAEFVFNTQVTFEKAAAERLTTAYSSPPV